MGSFALFFHFSGRLNSKILSLLFYFLCYLFSIYFFQFIFFLKNLIDDVMFTSSNFFEFGLHFSNLHINVYHVFDANFE
jgi:hypothetical protein